MSEPTPSANKLAERMEGTPETEAVVDPTQEVETEEVNEEEVAEGTESAEESEESNEETSEEELPENIKTILSKNRAEVKAANAEVVKLRKQLKELQDKPETEETETPSNDRYKTLFVNTAAKSALIDAGLSSGTERFVKMLDLDSVDVDEDGNITGLEDQVTSLKEEFKDLIVPKTPARKIAKTDAASRQETSSRPLTSAEKLAARMGAK